MSILLHLPPALAKLAGVEKKEVCGATVGEALDALDLQHPGVGLSDRIRNENSEVRQHVLIYVNDTEVRELQGLNTALRDGDKVFVVAAVSGG